MNAIRVLFTITGLLLLATLNAQVTYQDNDPISNTPLGYLGWNDNTNEDLNIRQNNTRRMRLTSVFWPGYNAAPSTPNASRMFLGIDGNDMNPPFSMMHLGYEIDVDLQRQWMDVGTTYGAGADIMYTGLMQSPGNSNNALMVDAVLAWGCNAGGTNGPDNLRFLFITPTNGNPGDPATAQEGLETMRIAPTGDVGIGNFAFNGINEQPTQKLDILGTARLRDMPLNTTPNAIIVGREVTAAGDYILSYREMPDDSCLVLNGEGDWIDVCDGLGGEDCRWFDASSITVFNEKDIFTGFDPTDDCNRGKLGVGTNLMRIAKIEGHNLTNRDSVFVGIYGNTFIDDQIYPPGTPALDLRYTGIFGECSGLPQPTVGITSFGVRGKSNVGKYVIGVYGEAFQDVNYSTTHTMGVRAEATHSDIYSALNIAVYAEIKPDPVTLNYGNDRALVTVGASTSVGPQILISDENVKTDIAPLENAAEILQQINPVTYIFESPENRKLPFSQNLQYGLIAQDVQEVMPEVVYSNTIPEAMDSLGIIEGSGLELLGIDYNSFIPILIQGFNEQNATVGDQAAQIASQNETIAALEAQLDTQAEQLQEMQNNMQSVLDAVQQMQQEIADADQRVSNCCTQKIGDADRSVGSESGNTGAVINEDMKQLKLEQNVPNPFDDQTRIAFNLPNEAQVILEITDAAGRPLERLIDGQLSSGEHTTLWDGSNVASGIYFYTLYADGELITKKMIKK